MRSFLKILVNLLAGAALTGCSTSKGFDTVDVNSFEKIIRKSDVQLLDVRSMEEFREGHISRAKLIDVTKPDFMRACEQALQKDQTVAVYCRSGRRSAMAAGQLAKKGYKVVNLEGGILAWKDAGYSIEK